MAGVMICGIALGFTGCNSSAPSAAGQGSASGSGPASAPAAPPAPATPPAAPPAAPPADPGFGEVAFKTFESNGTTVVFTSDVKAKVTWHNMVGGAVSGTYTQSGKNLEITWDLATATHYGTKSEKFKQMGPCSMARYERTDMKDKVHDNSPEIYQQIAPKCDTVRLTK